MQYTPERILIVDDEPDILEFLQVIDEHLVAETLFS